MDKFGTSHLVLYREVVLSSNINPFLGIGTFMHNFDTLVVCCTFCTLLVLNVVWSLIQGLQICKLRSYRLCS